ncbi:class I SAM-dependent methyltransferase, partial [Bacillus thuringiensis]
MYILVSSFFYFKKNFGKKYIMIICNDLSVGYYPTPLLEEKHLIQLLQMEPERVYACFD